MINLDLKPVSDLIRTIKKGIKQKSYITITESDTDDLRIIAETRNSKTKEYMYYQKTITTKELLNMDNHLHNVIIDSFIEEANHYFEKEQS